MNEFAPLFIRCLAFLIVCWTAGDISNGDEKPPNIVIILADDFGVGDIQAHYPDNKIATPSLDRLVRQGMSFTDAHSPSAVCSPTRYGLLTGRYAWRTRLQEWVIAAYEPPLITADRPTLPGFLRQHGYRTSCIGKWHLGWDWVGPQKGKMTEARNGQKNLKWDFEQPIGNGPVARGFEHYFGVALPNMPPFTFIENDRVTVQPISQYKYDPAQGEVMPRGFEGCPMAPGWQFDQIVPELTRRAVAEIHELAQQDKPFFLYYAMTSPHEPIVPSKDFKGKSEIAPIADFVMEIDWSAGQVIQAIDDAGIADNTIVVFTADNGHSHYTGWERLIAAGHFPSGPYRGHKGDVWEGGHRVPMVVRWPKRIEPGTTNGQMVCLTDWFATCADLIGAELPGNGAEDSFSFLASAVNKRSGAQPVRTSVVNHSNHGEFAFRDGKWKLVFKMSEKDLTSSRGKPTLPQLYNLETDIAESEDVAEAHPAIVERLTEQLEKLIQRGASRLEVSGRNDAEVRFDTIQMRRWAPPLTE